jgi:probable HAF family extracellular repeat protein
MPYTFQNMDVPGAASGTTAEGINDSGQITGSYEVGYPGDPYPQAYIQTPGSADIVSLGPNPYGAISYGFDINNLGQMVGRSGHYQQTGRGFIRNTDGTFTRIEYTGDQAYTYAYGINDHGAVVGQAQPFDGSTSVGFSWKNGNIVDTFKVPGADSTSANDVNNDGVVVGTYTVNGVQHGFVALNSQTMWGLDVPGSVSTDLRGISDTGEVVGEFTDASGQSHGFVDLANHFDQIDVPSATGTFINGVNNNGAIVGTYSVGSTPQHAFMATALDPEQCAVGENYLAAFGRETDPGGLSYWAGLLKAGMTAAQLSRDLAGSPEFRALHDQQNDRDYVDSIYANGLGRQADAGGESYWVGTLQSGTGRSDVLAAIAQSPEGHQHFSSMHA